MTDAEKAYTTIKERIITLQMPPGSSINLVELATELNLGRTPVREALKQLQSDNLVVVVQRRGMSVAEIALTDLRQLYEMRMALEPFCAHLAAERVTPASVEKLRRLAQSLQQADPENHSEWVANERQIHSIIAQSCANKYLEADTRHYFGLSLRIWYLVLDRLPPESVDALTHAALVEAIALHDGDQAEHFMRHHIDLFYQMARQAI